MSEQQILQFRPPLPVAVGATLEERFLAFHRANPWVMRRLVEMSRTLVGRGRRRIGIGMLFEVLRWDYYRHTDDPTSEFKLNNNHRAYYARAIMADHPDLKDLFETRIVK